MIPPPPAAPLDSWIRPVAMAGFGASLLVVLGLMAERTTLVQAVHWAETAGPAAWLVYILVCLGLTLTALPGAPLTATAGFIWGPWRGGLWAACVSVTCATLGFLLARHLLAAPLARTIASRRGLGALRRVSGRHGLRIVLLLRLSPLFPFGLVNYALGLGQVRARDFIMGTFLGMLPGTFMVAYLGSTAAEALALFNGSLTAAPWVARCSVAVAATATVGVVWAVTWWTRALLARELGALPLQEEGLGRRPPT